MSTTACDWVSSNERCLARTMANQEATTGSQSEESNALDLPSAYDIRDYVLQRPSQEANSEAFSSEEAFSIPCSSDTDPDPEPSERHMEDFSILLRGSLLGGSILKTFMREFPSPTLKGTVCSGIGLWQQSVVL
ncbi:shieldin complex subunit 1 isoform X4 [Globicephala melas]|uniref:shieldin complex subunit 1 isoform X4 n=1 Tax=Globicephala melas TaxID=9731 RepID=UPI00122F0EF3|nr:shieldin complex subunit 1 isoform X4 [Globicephala melas]